MRLLAISAVVLSAAAGRALVVDNWTSTSSALWGTAGNWSAGLPTGGNTAVFNNSAGLDTSITLLASSTAGSLSFVSTGGANPYTFDTAATANHDTLTITSGITSSDTASVTFYNAVTLAGAQAWANNGGTMAFDGNVNLGSGSSGYALTVNGNNGVNISGVIANGGSAAGSLIYSGTNTLTLSGANTYTGATTISTGTLNIQNAGALGTASNASNTTVASGAVLQIANNITTTNTGTLILNGTGAGAGALQNVSGNNTWGSSITLGSNATIYSSTAGNTLTIGNAGYTSLFTMGAKTLTVDGPGNTWFDADVGVAGDTGGLIKNGTGTLTMYAYDSYYTGATNINAGALNLWVGPFAAGYYAINGALTIGVGPSNPALAGTVSVNTYSNSVANEISPTSAVTINSDGILNNGIGTSLGSLTLNGGQVSNSSGVTVTVTGNITSNANSAHQTSLISGGTLDLTTGNISVTRDPTLTSDLTISSIVAGTAGLTETGNGILTLSGANTYTGATNLNGGALSIGADNNLGAAPGSATASDLTFNGGTLDTTATFTLNSNRGVTLNSGGGTFSPSAGTALTYGGIVAGTGSLTETGAGTLTLSGANTYTGATNLNGGVLSVGADNNLGAAPGSATASDLTFNGGTLDTTATFTLASNRGVTLNSGGGTFSPSSGTTLSYGGVIAGTGSLTETGAGTLTLTGTNTYTGVTNLNGGALAIAADANLGAAPGSVTAGKLTFNGGTLDTTATLTLNSNRGVTLNSGGGTFSPSSGTTLIYGGIVAGTGALTVNGGGTLNLTGTNTYTGATNLNSGTLSIGADAKLGAAPGSATANQLSFNGGVLSTTATFALNANRGMTVNSGGGTINAAAGTTLTYGGLIAGTGNLSLGSGTLNLTNNALSLGGSASVSSSELEFSGKLPSIGTLTLNSGSTLLLSGSDLSITNLVISGNAIIDFGSSASILNTTNFTLNAGATLTVMDWTNEVDYFYSANWTGATLGTKGTGPEAQVAFNGFSSSSTGWLSYDKEISPAPEPATYGAIFVGISLWGLLVHRRKRSAA